MRADGSHSASYLVDFVVRPKGVDAIVVAVFRRRQNAAGNRRDRNDVVEVLLRDGLRPALHYGRPPGELPVPDARPYLFFREVVAGIVESEDAGEAGLRRRAAVEVEEEAGYRVVPESVILLGAGTFPSPGSMAEKFFLAAVEVGADEQPAVPEGDGSPMEEDARLEWRPLEAAIAACVAGEIEDLKTEITMRRLRDWLGRYSASR